MRDLYRMLQVTVLLTLTLGTLSYRASEQTSSGTAAQNKPVTGPLEGVWREAEIVVTGANFNHTASGAQSLRLHANALRHDGDTRRSAADLVQDG